MVVVCGLMFSPELYHAPPHTSSGSITSAPLQAAIFSLIFHCFPWMMLRNKITFLGTTVQIYLSAYLQLNVGSIRAGDSNDSLSNTLTTSNGASHSNNSYSRLGLAASSANGSGLFDRPCLLTLTFCW